jgi:NAD-dependent deacetylase
MNSITHKLNEAAELIKHSSRTVAFTGVGISVESGIPPFRGENGLWSKYDSVFLDINYFHQNSGKYDN